LRPLSPYGFAIKTKTHAAYNTEEWLKFYFEGLDYVIKLNKGGQSFVESYAATILTKMLTPFDTGYVDLMSPAGIGISAIVYNYDGDVHASDESRMLAEMGDNTFRLGNVHRNSYDEIFLSDSLLNPLEESFASSVPMCTDCAFEPYCGADPVFHHVTQGDFVGRKPLSAFCERNMTIFRKLINLMEADEGTKRIFRRWAAG
jgi:radical SAM protein with 4Fe4S-binding SPASM domain